MDGSKEVGMNISRDELSLIGHVKVALSARVGTADMSVRDLMALVAGDVVELKESLDAPVDIMLDGRLMARAELLAVGNNYGLKILEIV